MECVGWERHRASRESRRVSLHRFCEPEGVQANGNMRAVQLRVPNSRVTTDGQPRTYAIFDTESRLKAYADQL
jgi:hypothetical protein